jgi:hypothetical protein
MAVSGAISKMAQVVLQERDSAFVDGRSSYLHQPLHRGRGHEVDRLPASRIEVIHNGCDFHPHETKVNEQTPSFAAPPEFFLFVGMLESW